MRLAQELNSAHRFVNDVVASQVESVANIVAAAPSPRLADLPTALQMVRELENSTDWAVKHWEECIQWAEQTSTCSQDGERCLSGRHVPEAARIEPANDVTSASTANDANSASTGTRR